LPKKDSTEGVFSSSGRPDLIPMNNAGMPRGSDLERLKRMHAAKTALKELSALKLFQRNISGERFESGKRLYSKPNAKQQATFVRNAGYNARVIPTSKGWRVFVGRKN